VIFAHRNLCRVAEYEPPPRSRRNRLSGSVSERFFLFGNASSFPRISSRSVTRPRAPAKLPPLLRIVSITSLLPAPYLPLLARPLRPRFLDDSLLRSGEALAFTRVESIATVPTRTHPSFCAISTTCTKHVVHPPRMLPPKYVERPLVRLRPTRQINETPRLPAPAAPAAAHSSAPARIRIATPSASATGATTLRLLRHTRSHSDSGPATPPLRATRSTNDPLRILASHSAAEASLVPDCTLEIATSLFCRSSPLPFASSHTDSYVLG
jgi:hypothetical protein